MKKHIFYSLIPFLLLFFACNNNQSNSEKEYIRNLEEKNRILEKELENSKRASKQNQAGNDRLTKRKEYFSLGATEIEVMQLMGFPEEDINIGSGRTKYLYGKNAVYFKNGKVTDYDNSDGKLKVK